MSSGRERHAAVAGQNRNLANSISLPESCRSAADADVEIIVQSARRADSVAVSLPLNLSIYFVAAYLY